MKVAVLGASGFIGSKFVELYQNKFEIAKLSSQLAPLNDYDKIKENTKNIDVLVHCAFDHSYKSNIVGIKNVLQVCKENNIKKLIYLSTVSVYDPDLDGNLNENSKYSNLNDPYSKEKRKIEKIIDDFDKSFDVFVLQPTIVYGLGGNWTKYALHVCKSQKTLLPNHGESKANIVYVDDVANAIYSSINSNIKYEKILISNEVISWREFYCKQCEILKELNLPSNCSIENDNSQNEFHSNNLINFIFTLWFKTPLGNIFDLMISTLKNIRAKNYKDTSSKDTLIKFLNSNIGQNVLNPSGITKKVHNAKFTADILKAKNILSFAPKYSFDKALQEMKKDIEEILK